MTNTYEDRIRRVLDYIHDNPAGDLSLDMLADVAALSRFHWHRVFHAMTGETCAQAVRRMRLHRGATWLVQTDQPVARIAADCGYGTVQSFTRAFSDSYHRSPAEFRRMGRLDAATPFRQKGKTLMFPVEIRTMPARKVTGLIHRGAYHTIGMTFEKAGAIINTRGLWEHCGPAIGMYFEDPGSVPEPDLRSLAGAEWNGGNAPDDFETVQITGGKTAVLTFKGPYASIKSGYDQLYGTWLAKAGELPADENCYEVYLNDPRDTAPEELLTDICIPLR